LQECNGGGGHHGHKKNGNGKRASAQATEEDLPVSKMKFRVIGAFLQRNHVENIKWGNYPLLPDIVSSIAILFQNLKNN
jgi:hypothetical protein